VLHVGKQLYGPAAVAGCVAMLMGTASSTNMAASITKNFVYFMIRPPQINGLYMRLAKSEAGGLPCLKLCNRYNFAPT